VSEIAARTLATLRGTLGAPTPADRDAIVQLMTDPDVRRFLGGPATPERAQSRAARIAAGSHPTTWAVHLMGDPSAGLIGLVQITPHHDGADDELSYEFLPAAWGGDWRPKR
jgi:ribosomal-protein-alanine N-acetyltransferase